MIQELFGGGKDINIISAISFPPPLPFSSPPTPTPTSSTTTLANTSNSSSSVGNNNNNNNNNSNSETNNGQIKLRCPRCDSTNTKFCYYNNYNLTQPRHFCKTCRRYWTRGGTLRNVPIGGGCRKNKTASSTTVSTSSSSSAAAAISGFSKSTSFNALVRAATNCNTRLSADLLFPGNPGRVRVLGNGLTDPQTCPNPTFWPPPQSSHILALFNPSPLSSTTTTTQGLFDPYGANGAPNPLGSFHRSHQVVNGFGLGPGPEPMVQNSSSSSNIMELYQKLKSSSGGYGYCGHENHGPLNLGNVMGSSSSTTTTSTSTSTLASSSSGYIVGNVAGDTNNLASYGTITNPSWNEFSTVPINGAFP